MNFVWEINLGNVLNILVLGFVIWWKMNKARRQIGNHLTKVESLLEKGLPGKQHDSHGI